MTKTQHTQGPWFIRNWDNLPDQQVISDETNTRCIALIDKEDEQDEANAHLIAAAPELLENSEEQTILIHDVLQALYNAPEFKGRKNLVERLQKSLGVSQDLNAKARGQS